MFNVVLAFFMPFEYQLYEYCYFKNKKKMYMLNFTLFPLKLRQFTT